MSNLLLVACCITKPWELFEEIRTWLMIWSVLKCLRLRLYEFLPNFRYPIFEVGNAPRCRRRIFPISTGSWCLKSHSVFHERRVSLLSTSSIVANRGAADNFTAFGNDTFEYCQLFKVRSEMLTVFSIINNCREQEGFRIHNEKKIKPLLEFLNRYNTIKGGFSLVLWLVS